MLRLGVYLFGNSNSWQFSFRISRGTSNWHQFADHLKLDIIVINLSVYWTVRLLENF